MSLNRYAARVDSNQAAIVQALRDDGNVVWIIGWPVDLLVGIYAQTPMKAKWLPMEVKLPGKEKSGLTDDQKRFLATCGYLPNVVVSDVEGALRAVRCFA